MNPLPYFVLDKRKRSDNRYRIYIRQNLRPATMIATELFVNSESDFTKKGFPKDPVAKNHCLALLKQLEEQEKKLGGASTLRECWDVMTTKPSKSGFVVDWVMLPFRHQVSKFKPKWKIVDLTRDNLQDYLNFLKKAGLKDVTIGNHIAELKRAGKNSKRYYEAPQDLYEFKPKLRQSLPREPLNWIEMMKLYNLPPSPSLDMFLLECFTGIRYSDLTENLQIKETYILLLQTKTGKIAAPALNPIAKAILLRNSTRSMDGEILFSPHRVSVQTINRALKLIATKHGINKNLSTHIGRHSYAKLLSDLGVPENIRAVQLGHSPIGNTQIYGRSSDYEFASRFVLLAFQRAMASKAKTYENWMKDINPIFREVYSAAV